MEELNTQGTVVPEAVVDEQQEQTSEQQEQTNEQQEPTQQPSGPNENTVRLYEGLLKKGLTDAKSADEFHEYFSSGQNYDQLHDYLKKNNMTSLEPGDFQAKYFGNQEDRFKKKNSDSTQPSAESESSEPSTQDSQPSSESSEVQVEPDQNDFGLGGGYSLSDVADKRERIREIQAKADSLSDVMTNQSVAHLSASQATSKLRAQEAEYNSYVSEISELNKSIKDVEAVWWMASKEQEEISEDAVPGLFGVYGESRKLSERDFAEIGLEYIKDKDPQMYEKYNEAYLAGYDSVDKYMESLEESERMKTSGAGTSSAIARWMLGTFMEGQQSVGMKTDYELRSLGRDILSNYLDAQSKTVEAQFNEKFGEDAKLLTERDEVISSIMDAEASIEALTPEGFKGKKKALMSASSKLSEEASVLDVMGRRLKAAEANGTLTQEMVDEYDSLYNSYNASVEDYNKSLKEIKSIESSSGLSEAIEKYESSFERYNQIQGEIGDDGMSILAESSKISDKINSLKTRNDDLMTHPAVIAAQKREDRLQERYKDLTNDQNFDGLDEYGKAFLQPAAKLIQGVFQVGYVAEEALGGTDGYSMFEYLYDISNNVGVDDLMLPQVSQQALFSDEGVAPAHVWMAKSFNTLGSVATFMGTGMAGAGASTGLGLTAKLGSNLAIGASAYTMQVGDNYREAVEAGMDRQEAAWSAEALSIVSAATELIVSEVGVADDILTAVNRTVTGEVMKRKAAGEILDKAVVSDIAKKAFKTAASKLPKSMLSEGLEEATEQATGDMTRSAINLITSKAEGVQYYNPEEIGDVYNYTESFILGAIGGLGTAAGPVARQGVKALFPSIRDIHPRVASVIVQAAESEEELKRITDSFPNSNKKAAEEFASAVADYKQKMEFVEVLADINNLEGELTNDEKFQIAYLSQEEADLRDKLNANKDSLSEAEIEVLELLIKSKKDGISNILTEAATKVQEREDAKLQESQEQSQQNETGDGGTTEQAATETQAQEVQPEQETAEDSDVSEPEADRRDTGVDRTNKEQQQKELDEYNEAKAKRQQEMADEAEKLRVQRESEERESKKPKPGKRKRVEQPKRRPKAEEKARQEPKPETQETPLQGTITLSEAITGYDDGDVQLRSFAGKKFDTPLQGNVYIDQRGDVIFATKDQEYVLGSIHDGKSNPLIDINQDVSSFGLELSNQGSSKYDSQSKSDKQNQAKNENARSKPSEKRDYGSEFTKDQDKEGAEPTERQPVREPVPESDSDLISNNVGRVIRFSINVDGKKREVRATIEKENGAYFLSMDNVSGERFLIGTESEVENSKMSLAEISNAKVEEQAVIAFTDGTFSIEGKNYVPATKNPTDSIKRNAKGDVVAILMRDENGNLVEIINYNSERSLADAVAYEILLAANDIEISQETEARLEELSNSDKQVEDVLSQGDPEEPAKERVKPTPNEVLEDAEEASEEKETIEDETQQESTEDAAVEEEQQQDAEPEQTDELADEGADTGATEDVRQGDVKKEEPGPKLSPEERMRADAIRAEKEAKEKEAKKQGKETKAPEKKEEKKPTPKKRLKEEEAEGAPALRTRKRPTVKSDKKLTAEDKKLLRDMKSAASELAKAIKLAGRSPSLKILARELLVKVPVDGIGVQSEIGSAGLTGKQMAKDYIFMANKIAELLKQNSPIGDMVRNQMLSDIDIMSRNIPDEYISRASEEVNKALNRMTKSTKAQATYILMIKKLLKAHDANNLSEGKAVALDYLGLANTLLEAARGNTSMNPKYFELELERITGVKSDMKKEAERADSKTKKEVKEEKTPEQIEAEKTEEAKKQEEQRAKMADDVTNNLKNTIKNMSEHNKEKDCN